MAREQVVRLFREAQLNPNLRDKFSAAPNVEAFIRLAQEHGYDFSFEEWQESMRFSVEELKCKVSEIPGI